MPLDADYFAQGVVDRLRARMRELQQRLSRILRFHAVYQGLFLGPDGEPSPNGKAVLLDLDAFCFGDGAWHDDAREHARREGRREVLQYILSGLKMDHPKIRALKLQLEDMSDE